MSVLGPIMSIFPYLRFALVWFLFYKKLAIKDRLVNSVSVSVTLIPCLSVSVTESPCMSMRVTESPFLSVSVTDSVCECD